ncbi:hypothetical protein G7054_g6315 [Neopestalotiopsis clavispora]|nr:hypothetical protein G7054_g6315 [Neopestalotiopsis clavispora]
MRPETMSIRSASQIEPENVEESSKKDGDGTPVSLAPRPNTAMFQKDGVAEEQSKYDEILALQPKMADTLATFLKDMEPYKQILPDPAWDRLGELEKMSKAFQALEKPSKKTIRREDVKKWSCIVYKDDMNNWPRNTFSPPMDPHPIIEAFYDNFDETLNATVDAGQAGQDIGNSLQRVVIRSDILLNELQKITPVKHHGFFIVPPPFKLLVFYFPQIDARLVALENELEERDPVGQLSNHNLHTEDIDNESRSTNMEESSSRDVSDADTTVEVEQAQEDKKHRIRSQLRKRIDHLKCLRNFIQTDLRHLIELRTQIENKSLEKISFQNLWYLFKPGDVVLSTRNTSKVLFKVYSVTGGQKRTQVRSAAERSYRPVPFRPPHRPESSWDYSSGDDEDLIEAVLHDQLWGVGSWVSFKVDAYSLESNGKHVGPMPVFKKIKHYDGEIRILDLDVYPVQFHPEHTTLIRQIEERGRKYLRSSGHKSYDGYTAPRSRRDQREELQGDVFVDLETYLQTHTRRIQQFGKLETSLRDSSVNGEGYSTTKTDSEISYTNHEIDVALMGIFLSSIRQNLLFFTPEQALASPDCLQLMPSTVPGYAFSLRKWCGLEVDLISEIDTGRESRGANFDDLVIPDTFRDMLIALVENHTSRSQRLQARETGIERGQDRHRIDIVRGKGQGLIILLHGPPGSGKTSTAETIAAFTQRPLYSITCGDLGLEPNEVESALQQHMKKADRWGCVLLLDEADVFLMQRDWQDVKRNALVSVLLRQLEYYSGILFLTTNRPGVIDEAFISRIHLSLRYPLIDLAATKRMWSNIMNRIEQDNEASQIKVVFDRERLLAFAEQHYIRREKTGTTWNGRQIRNAIQTAIALGISERMKMLNMKGITPEQAIESGKRRLVEIKLTRTNLLKISQTARAFEDYMQHLRGNDSDLARQTEVRDDHFDSAAPRATKDYGDRQSVARRADSFGIAKGASAAKTSIGAGKSRQRNSRKSRNMSEGDDDGDDSLDERSDGSDVSDADESDEF